MALVLNQLVSEDLIQLFRLLRCEASSIEAYGAAIDDIYQGKERISTGLDEDELGLIQRDHEEAYRWITREIEDRGGTLAQNPHGKPKPLRRLEIALQDAIGTWGADLHSLREKEERSLQVYRELLQQEELDEKIEELVKAFLLPTVQSHLAILNRYVNKRSS